MAKGFDGESESVGILGHYGQNFMFTSVKLAFKGCQWPPLNAILTDIYYIDDVGNSSANKQNMVTSVAEGGKPCLTSGD